MITKYAVIGMYGYLGVLVIYSLNCNPSLLKNEATRIAQQIFDPYCYVKSYNAELEGSGYPYTPRHETFSNMVASGTSNISGTSVSPYSI